MIACQEKGLVGVSLHLMKLVTSILLRPNERSSRRSPAGLMARMKNGNPRTTKALGKLLLLWGNDMGKEPFVDNFALEKEAFINHSSLFNANALYTVLQAVAEAIPAVKKEKEDDGYVTELRRVFKRLGHRVITNYFAVNEVNRVPIADDGYSPILLKLLLEKNCLPLMEHFVSAVDELRSLTGKLSTVHKQVVSAIFRDGRWRLLLPDSAESEAPVVANLSPQMHAAISHLCAARMDYLDVPAPVFTWSMPEAKLGGHPKVQQFLHGTEEVMTIITHEPVWSNLSNAMTYSSLNAERILYRRQSSSRTTFSAKLTQENKTLVLDEKQPKKPKSSFTIFSAEQRITFEALVGAEIQIASVLEFTKAIRKKWDSMDEKAMAKYIQLEVVSMQEYEAAMDIYDPDGAKRKAAAEDAKTKIITITKTRAYHEFLLKQHEKDQAELKKLNTLLQRIKPAGDDASAATSSRK